MENGTDGRTVKLIRLAVIAGGLRAGARQWPDAARGLLMAADDYSRRVQAQADEMAGLALAASPRRR